MPLMLITIDKIFQVLSDSIKKKDYDEQLKKEESKSVSHQSHNTSNQVLLCGLAACLYCKSSYQI